MQSESTTTVAPHTSRRDFLKGTAAVVARASLPATSVSLLSFSEVATAAIDPGTAVAIGSAVLSMMNKGGGAGKQLAAMNLKLDQILRNQRTIMEAISALEESIAQLPKQYAGLQTNEAYFKLRERAAAFTKEIELLITRPIPPKEKIGDYSALFGRFYIDLIGACTRIENRSTDTAGLMSVVHAGKAALFYFGSLAALATFEVHLPPKDRWKDNRAFKVAEMARLLEGTLSVLRTKRTPEALSEQQAAERNAYAEAKESYIGELIPRMLVGGVDSEVNGSRTLSVCLRSAEKVKRGKILDGSSWSSSGPFKWVTATFLQTLDLPMSFNVASIVLPDQQKNIATSLHSKRSEWKRRFWVYDKGDQKWRDTRDDDIQHYKTFGYPKGFGQDRDELSAHSSNPCLQVQRDGKPDELKLRLIEAEIEKFGQDLERHAQAVRNQEAIWAVDAGCEMISGLVAEFVGNMVLQSQPTHDGVLNERDVTP
jgi:hypothetical protein